jgi:predicted Rossmann fold flavoprotein
VVDVLRFGLQKENIRLLTGAEVTRVKKAGEGFTVTCNGDSFDCDKLIVACGGLAGTKLGGSMSGYQLLRSFGHKCTKLRPALVQLKSDWNGCVALKGVRTNCVVEIFHNDNLCATNSGQLQFTEYGLSGPVIFDISRDVCQGAGQWLCKLNFLPSVQPQWLVQELLRRKEMPIGTDDLLTGILHNRLGRVLTAAAGIRPQDRCRDLTESDICRVAVLVQGLEVTLTGTMGMDSAQVTAGGISTVEFDPETMESRLVPGLYACGEVLDIDGDCGGYNLQWAWSSGRLAGASAGGSL